MQREVEAFSSCDRSTDVTSSCLVLADAFPIYAALMGLVGSGLLVVLAIKLQPRGARSRAEASPEQAERLVAFVVVLAVVVMTQLGLASAHDVLIVHAAQLVLIGFGMSVVGFGLVAALFVLLREAGRNDLGPILSASWVLVAATAHAGVLGAYADFYWLLNGAGRAGLDERWVLIGISVSLAIPAAALVGHSIDPPTGPQNARVMDALQVGPKGPRSHRPVDAD